MSRPTREVCFLIDRDGEVLWLDRSTSASALPDSRDRWRAIWQHRDELAVIAHSHPHGPPAFSAEDRSTMAAIDAALGRALTYAVVTIDAIIYRGPDPGAVSREPAWATRLRDESGMVEADGDSERHLPRPVG